MKRVLFFTPVVLAATVTAAFCFGGRLWPDSRKPPRSLPDAYSMAIQALGSATNDFHCISSQCTGVFPSGAWVLKFCNPQGRHKTVIVLMEPTYYGEGRKKGQLLMPLTRVEDE